MANRYLVSWQRNRCSPLLLAVAVAVLLGGCANAAPTSKASSTTAGPQQKKGVSQLPRLEANGIGIAHFGASRANVLATLQESLGQPNATGINTGCGSGFREVAWHDFIAEFRLGTFTGYRFATGGFPLPGPGSPDDRVSPNFATPALSTTRGITLGSTLKELQSAYPQLTRSGALKWTAPNGLIFVEASDTSNPLSPAARIAEIKIGTCGTY
jgi:hypothetical protein